MVNVNHFKNPSVYALHAGDFQIRYIGSTSVNSRNRLYQHVSRARHNHSAPVYQWMREVGIENVRVFDLLNEPDDLMRSLLEVASIYQLTQEGHPLVNSIYGKDARNERSPKQQARMDAHRARLARSEAAKPTPEPRVKEPRVPQHGTRTEADKYKCKCDPCRMVMAQRNAARRGTPIPLVAPLQMGVPRAHGTVARYKRGCKCDPCRAAFSAMRRSRAA